jgi:hypothetical protein
VKKQAGAVQKHGGAIGKMTMTLVAAIEEALVVIVEASMMKTMTKETVREVNGVLQAGAMMNIIR